MRRLLPILAVLAAAIGCTVSAPAVLDPDPPSRALRLPAWVDAAVAERSRGAAPVTTARLPRGRPDVGLTRHALNDAFAAGADGRTIDALLAATSGLAGRFDAPGARPLAVQMGSSDGDRLTVVGAFFLLREHGVPYPQNVVIAPGTIARAVVDEGEDVSGFLTPTLFSRRPCVYGRAADLVLVEPLVLPSFYCGSVRVALARPVDMPPSAGQVYRLEALPEEAPLARLLRELARGPRPSAASVQLAVWAASGVSDLPAGARALGEVPVGSADLDAALRLLVAAGLDPAGLPLFGRHPS